MTAWLADHPDIKEAAHLAQFSPRDFALLCHNSFSDCFLRTRCCPAVPAVPSAAPAVPSAAPAVSSAAPARPFAGPQQDQSAHPGHLAHSLAPVDAGNGTTLSDLMSIVQEHVALAIQGLQSMRMCQTAGKDANATIMAALQLAEHLQHACHTFCSLPQKAIEPSAQPFCSPTELSLASQHAHMDISPEGNVFDIPGPGAP